MKTDCIHCDERGDCALCAWMSECMGTEHCPVYERKEAVDGENR